MTRTLKLKRTVNNDIKKKRTLKLKKCKISEEEKQRILEQQKREMLYDVVIKEFMKRKNHDDDFIRMNSKQTAEIKLCEAYGIDKETCSGLDIFILKPKQAYYSNWDFIIPYINKFVEVYDYDSELIMCYMRMKFLIDRKKKYMKETFIDDLYEMFCSETMVEKIGNMTRDYYGKVKLRARKEYKHKGIQFTDEHGFIILSSAICIKLMIPVVTHYIATNGINKTDDFLFYTFSKVLKIFESANNMQNKLYELVLSKLKKTEKRDALHWQHVEIDGKDLDYETETMFGRLLTDIIYKCSFSGNIAAFLSASINKNINWMLKAKFDKNNFAISDKKNEDGLSDLDKIEMNMSKFDESLICAGEINAVQVIKQLKEKFHVHWTKKELYWYMDNFNADALQEKMINNIYGKYFKSVTSIRSSVGRKNYTKLVLILRHMLKHMGFDLIQFIFTSDIHYNPNVRKIPKKEMNDILNSELFNDILEKYSICKDIIFNEKFFHSLNEILNADVRLIMYDNEYNGKKLINNRKKIIEEYLRVIRDVI